MSSAIPQACSCAGAAPGGLAAAAKKTQRCRETFVAQEPSWLRFLSVSCANSASLPLLRALNHAGQALVKVVLR